MAHGDAESTVLEANAEARIDFRAGVAENPHGLQRARAKSATRERPPKTAVAALTSSHKSCDRVLAYLRIAFLYGTHERHAAATVPSLESHLSTIPPYAPQTVPLCASPTAGPRDRIVRLQERPMYYARVHAGARLDEQVDDAWVAVAEHRRVKRGEPVEVLLEKRLDAARPLLCLSHLLTHAPHARVPRRLPPLFIEHSPHWAAEREGGGGAHNIVELHGRQTLGAPFAFAKHSDLRQRGHCQHTTHNIYEQDHAI